MSERIAIVVVHGMGNQFPMDTLRGFTASLKPPGEIEYSSPNRITEETETRRLSFSKSSYDFYEYYWAYLVDEPAFAETILWALKLLFIKKPSKRMSEYIGIARFFVVFLLIVIICLGYLIYHYVKADVTDLLKATYWGLLIGLVLKTCWELISSTVVGSVRKSIGDVLKYTVPSPQNIATRDKIRKHGVELLKNLHEAKNENGNFKYAKIVVVGHSLGSIVSYDILKSLFAQYHLKYSNIPDVIDQPALEKLKAESANPGENYQQFQSALYKEYKTLGNEWRVSKFITLGSPLTHAPMLLAKSADEFSELKQHREFPTSPPQIDLEDEHFAFPKTFKRMNKNPPDEKDIKILHHAAYFAETQWINIYFENDWIGGNLSEQLGPGIKDIAIKGNKNLLGRLPLTTHTKYWDPAYPQSIDEIKKHFSFAK